MSVFVHWYHSARFVSSLSFSVHKVRVFFLELLCLVRMWHAQFLEFELCHNFIPLNDIFNQDRPQEKTSSLIA